MNTLVANGLSSFDLEIVVNEDPILRRESNIEPSRRCCG